MQFQPTPPSHAARTVAPVFTEHETQKPIALLDVIMFLGRRETPITVSRGRSRTRLSTWGPWGASLSFETAIGIPTERVEATCSDETRSRRHRQVGGSKVPALGRAVRGLAGDESTRGTLRCSTTPGTTAMLSSCNSSVITNLPEKHGSDGPQHLQLPSQHAC